MKGICDSCKWSGEVKGYEQGSPHGQKTVSLCTICANTIIGNLIAYPGMYDHGVIVIAQNMAFLTNLILAALQVNAKQLLQMQKESLTETS